MKLRIRLIFLFIVVLFCICKTSFAGNFFKITYITTLPVESIEMIINKFAKNHNNSVKNKLFRDIKKRNPHIVDWYKIPINSTVTIVISKKTITNDEINSFISMEKKKRQNQDASRLKRRYLTSRHSVLAGYFLRKTTDTRGFFTVQSIFAPFLNLGHEYFFLHSFNRWNIKNLQYHTLINFHKSEANNNLQIPLAYSLRGEIILARGTKSLSPYLAMSFDVSPNLADDGSGNGSGLVIRVNKNLSAGMGVLFQYNFKKLKIAMSTDYLIDIFSTSQLEEATIDGGLLGSELSHKLRFEYKYNFHFINSWLIEAIYATSSRANEKKDNLVSNESYIINLGFIF
ncbi:MAG: hypothetical protein A2504_08565 [Bdellovibrionales bacterium RIFOXYD12_FULL_39_22]|nr:MAG: hypothetical protein A2385_01790 [Bdellovibrionales bacterium RIFOXYB1_FULL_39_21]OFZ42825.1 MAG: hypothetical protein A2485_10585 [Bdellovibrionales bacterium RIFOXYC12_FULL_39_17]OFZ47516.1 MAG: hypothetical protein A2404_14710 [Bdellovibrionales bacterium RIFOXYC1_FULL_39_130]OFZ75604.1 MAG: hypothetical protein A2560_14860 [Bdellovibrionales bacterium RIFOXYD1_FULL_39_84]OFZ93927.1 MAG: hypothetical protein A2504_08565 [Bdellovibrionales bacterium RIFOXYD12_FULL_39_22]